MEFPFVPPEVASRSEGRDAIRARARQVWGQSPLRAEEFSAVTIEEANPAVLFAEYEVRGTVIPSGEPFRVPAAVVLRTRGGAIASLREYLDPIALVQATGAVRAHGGSRRGGESADEGTPGARLEATQTLVRRYFEMWNTGDWKEADAVLGRTYFDHAHPGVIGPAAARSLVRRFRAENPGARMTIGISAFDAEFVVVRRTIRWTAHGKSEPCGIALFRIADGQLAEQWSWSPDVQRGSTPSPREWPIA